MSLLQVSLLVGLSFLSHTTPVSGYGTGAPRSACYALRPVHHNVHPSTKRSPYTLVPAETDGEDGVVRYTPGQVFTFHIRGDFFAGFLFEVRDEDNEAHGTFTPVENKAKVLKCTHDGSAITHMSATLRTEHELEFRWTPPEGLNKEVKIKGTIAKARDEFWIGQELQLLPRIAPQASPTTKPDPEKVEASKKEVESSADPEAESSADTLSGVVVLTILGGLAVWINMRRNN